MDFATGVVRLEGTDTKNGRAREFPFDVFPELAALLRAQRERTTLVERRLGRIVPEVFHRNGRPIVDTTHAWRRACEQAGRPGVLFHDLRRSAVRRLERAGVPRSVATDEALSCAWRSGVASHPGQLIAYRLSHETAHRNKSIG